MAASPVKRRGRVGQLLGHEITWEPDDAEYPSLWTGLLGGPVPCLAQSRVFLDVGSYRTNLKPTYSITSEANMTYAMSPWGPCFSSTHPTEASFCHITGAASRFKISTPLTVMWAGALYSGSVDNRCYMFLTDSKAGSPSPKWAGYILLWQETTEELFFCASDNTQTTLLATTSGMLGSSDIYTLDFASGGGWNVIVAAASSEPFESDSTAAMWINGEWVGGSVSSGGISAVHGAARNSLWGGWGAGSVATGGKHSMAACLMWNRYLRPDEIQLISSDPIAPFRRRTRTIARIPSTRVVSLGGIVKRDRIVLAG